MAILLICLCKANHSCSLANSFDTIHGQISLNQPKAKRDEVFLEFPKMYKTQFCFTKLSIFIRINRIRIGHHEQKKNSNVVSF